MSTRSNILVKLDNETYGCIYAHWDGYPSYRGPLLLKNYRTWSKCKRLVKLGNLSSLAPKILPNKKKGEHTFENPQKDVTVFYGRDRGEVGQGFRYVKASTPQEALDIFKEEADVFIEYYYFFDGVEWFIGEPHEWKIEKLETVMQSETPNQWKYGNAEE